ncbi:hypothetical protein TruAng_000834 [Truncatella angustata]|nr:hypothetical protein TruAng_000834 [Truncatella angustata]
MLSAAAMATRRFARDGSDESSFAPANALGGWMMAENQNQHKSGVQNSVEMGTFRYESELMGRKTARRVLRLLPTNTHSLFAENNNFHQAVYAGAGNRSQVKMPNSMNIDMSRRNKSPRPLSDNERARLEEFIDSIHYSARYSDSEYEYRHVQLPKAMLKAIPKDYHDPSHGTLKLLWEDEWRAIGITQSLGWEHYEVHEPEPHILLFK